MRIRFVAEYLTASGHGNELEGPLFRRIRAPEAEEAACALTSGQRLCRHRGSVHGPQVGIAGDNLSQHALRATAATSALEHQADIAKVQEWLGRANIGMTGGLSAGGFADVQGGLWLIGWVGLERRICPALPCFCNRSAPTIAQPCSVRTTWQGVVLKGALPNRRCTPYISLKSGQRPRAAWVSMGTMVLLLAQWIGRVPTDAHQNNGDWQAHSFGSQHRVSYSA